MAILIVITCLVALFLMTAVIAGVLRARRTAVSSAAPVDVWKLAVILAWTVGCICLFCYLNN
jgi:hypothetical protein